MPLVLAPLSDPAGPLSIDLDGILPDRVRGLSLPEIAGLRVQADGSLCDLGELFSIDGDPADNRIECRGDFSRVHRIGARLAAGGIDVRGCAGRHTGAGMAGGRLTVAGNAGDWLAAEMTGGELVVEGDAGDNAASALPGSPYGVRGGIVIVGGSVGSLAGGRMRRGILAVGGDCGAAAAFEMRAGTVVVGGRVGQQPALGMRRGSLIALGPNPEIPPAFSRGAAWSPAFLPLLLRRLERAGFRGTPALEPGPWRQWHGDLLAGGGGEILCREGS
jgi:formylmethanofuran dehydrogenase subunit C